MTIQVLGMFMTLALFIKGIFINDYILIALGLLCFLSYNAIITYAMVKTYNK